MEMKIEFMNANAFHSNSNLADSLPILCFFPRMKRVFSVTSEIAENRFSATLEMGRFNYKTGKTTLLRTFIKVCLFFNINAYLAYAFKCFVFFRLITY